MLLPAPSWWCSQPTHGISAPSRDLWQAMMRSVAPIEATPLLIVLRNVSWCLSGR